MSLAYPSRYQSYASLRLAVFTSLFESSLLQSHHTFPSSRKTIDRDGRQQHRAFRSSAIKPKQRGSRNFQNDQELRTFMEERLVNNSDASPPPAPTTPEATPESRSSVKLSRQRGSRNLEKDQELRPFIEERLVKDDTTSKPSATNIAPEITSEDSVSTLDTSERARQPKQKWSRNVDNDQELRVFPEERVANDGNGSTPPTISRKTTSPKSNPESSRPISETPGDPRPWYPYSKAGLEDLRALVSDLKKSATEYVDFEKEFHDTPARGVKRVKLDLKNSPIRNEAKNKIIKFSGPQLDADGQPFDDPGHVEHPNLVSVDLPESPVIRRLRVMKPQKRAPTKDEIERLLYNPWALLLASPLRQCHGTGVRLPIDLMVTWELVRRPSDQDVYLMPRQLAVLDKLKPGWYDKEGYGGLWKSGFKGTKEVNSEGGEEAPSISRDPKTLGVMVRILPYQPLTQQLTGRMIRKAGNGKDVTKTGAVQRLLPQRQKNQIKVLKHYFGEDEEILNPNALQWQPDIAERMKGIMRVRVLTALETLGETLGIQGGRGSAFEIISIEALSTGHISIHLEEDRSRFAKYSFFASQRPFDTVEGNENRLDNIQESIIDAFGGSIILYVNAREPANIPDQPSPVLSRLAMNLLPQTICLENILRIPVFDLRQLMGKPSRNVTARRCRRVMQTYPVLHPPRNEDATDEDRAPGSSDAESDTDTDADVPYLLLITKRAARAHALTKELWQLWRYVGGNLEEELRVKEE